MPGLLRGVARTAVVAGTATAVSNRVSRRQGERWAARQQAQYGGYGGHGQAPAYQPPAQPGATDMDARIAQLKELAALKDQGVLSEAEFERQKAAILGP